jgi:hypothetical protein
VFEHPSDRSFFNMVADLSLHSSLISRVFVFYLIHLEKLVPFIVFVFSVYIKTTRSVCQNLTFIQIAYEASMHLVIIYIFLEVSKLCERVNNNTEYDVEHDNDYHKIKCDI